MHIFRETPVTNRLPIADCCAIELPDQAANGYYTSQRFLDSGGKTMTFKPSFRLPLLAALCLAAGFTACSSVMADS
jgi:hypothetical protein